MCKNVARATGPRDWFCINFLFDGCDFDSGVFLAMSGFYMLTFFGFVVDDAEFVAFFDGGDYLG